MNRILIVGEHSYVGDSFAAYLRKFSEEYSVRKLSVRQPCWKEESFQDIDVIYYVAAIVHRKESSVPEEEFYRVNCQLPFDVALKAKQEGVKQFIFVSTMSVYGMLTGCIRKETVETPVTLYGKTKLEAERKLNTLSSENFRLVIIRPPMIYGKGCKGNFARLEKVARVCPMFPFYPNTRSMLYIENLNVFVEQIIRKKMGGIFFPQDRNPVSTWEIYRIVRESNNKRPRSTKLFNGIIKLLGKKIKIVKKVWGSLQYAPEMSEYEDISYWEYDLSAALYEIEGKI